MSSINKPLPMVACESNVMVVKKKFKKVNNFVIFLMIKRGDRGRRTLYRGMQ